MTPGDICSRSAAALATAIAGREISPVAVVEATLARIDCLQPALNAFCTVTADHARAAARRAEQQAMRGERGGPLHGVPVSVSHLGSQDA